MEIAVEAPEVNASEAEFAVRNGSILFGLCAIKDVESRQWRQSFRTSAPWPLSRSFRFVDESIVL